MNSTEKNSACSQPCIRCGTDVHPTCFYIGSSGPYCGRCWNEDLVPPILKGESCVKCGGANLKLAYRPPSWTLSGGRKEVYEETLIITCANCGFSWKKPPLDAKK